MHSPRTVLYRPAAGWRARITTSANAASCYWNHRRPSHRAQAAGSQHNADATAQVGQPPVLPQHDHVDVHHGQARRDEYSWIRGKGPTDPEILGYLKSENHYTIHCLAHTRDLQLKLQHSLQAWQQAEQVPANNSKLEQLQALQQPYVGPDWLAGTGYLQYQPCKHFGYPGMVIGEFRFFSLPSATTTTTSSSRTAGMMHYRMPASEYQGTVSTADADAAAAAAAAVLSDGPSSIESTRHLTAEALPAGTLVLWDETGCCSSSNVLLRSHSSSTHSLAVSPCGCYLAVTYSSSLLDNGRYDLSVIDCSTGQSAVLPVRSVDGPILWVPPTPAAVSSAAAAAVGNAGNKAVPSDGTFGPPESRHHHQQQQQQQQQLKRAHRQYLVYVADDCREVYCLGIGTGADVDSSGSSASGKNMQRSDALIQPCAPAANEATAAAAAEKAQAGAPASRLIYEDSQHVSLNIASANGLTFITVYAADGLIRQVLYYTGGGGGLTPDQAEAWQVLLPAGTVARLLSASASSNADCCTDAAGSSSNSSEVVDDDPTCRLAVMCVDDLLLVRHSCSALPQGQLFLGRLPQQLTQQLMDWQLLLGAQSDLILEATFVCHEHSSSSSTSSMDCTTSGRVEQALQLVVLGWKPYNWAQHHQQQRQQLEAQLYRLVPGHHVVEESQKPQQIQLLPECICIVPVPDAFFEVHSASWHPQQCELQVEFSSFARPRSRVTVSLAQHMTAQHQVQHGLLHEAHDVMEQASNVVTTQDSSVDSNAGCSTDAAVPPVSQVEQLMSPLAGHNQADYVTQQIGAPSLEHDIIIPVSLAYKRTKMQLPSDFVSKYPQKPQRLQHERHDTPNPKAAVRSPMRHMLLSCYGSYGIRECVAFSPELLLLLDAGWLVAVAHVRGGGWCGRAWAEAGRGTGKANSVKDLLAVAEYVHKVGLVSHGGLCLQGASAGGWLAASVVLKQPQLFAAAVLTVPCLDPLGALLQCNQGGLELGAAATDPEVYASIRSWAPYDLLEQALYPAAQRSPQPSEQLASVLPAGSTSVMKQQQQTINSTQHAPHILIRAALGDQEVPISDPVKALARLRRWYSMQCRQQQPPQEPDSGMLAALQSRLPPSDGAAAGDDVSCGTTLAAADLTNRMLLLRVVPGGHTAFQASVRESALKVAFLMTVVES